MYTESKNGTKKLTTYQLTLTAVMAAVICVLGPISMAIPISPVPISLASMAVYLAVTVLGMKLGTLSCLIYLLLGLVGLPVFSGGSAGAAKLFGPCLLYTSDAGNHGTLCARYSLAGLFRRYGFPGGSVGRRDPVYLG